MSEKVNRRRVLTAGAAGVAVAAAVSVPALASASPEALTSPRIERLRALMAEVLVIEARARSLDPLEDGSKCDDDMDAVIDKIAALANEIFDEPASGNVKLLELALVAQNYWADGVLDNGRHVMVRGEGCNDHRAAMELIIAVLEMVGAPEGGAYV